MTRLFTPSPTPAIDVEQLMLDHKIVSCHVEPGTDDDVIVICKCMERFDLGESHTLHVFGVLRDSSASTTDLTNAVRALPASKQDDFDQALRIGRFAADDVAIGFNGTPAQRTGAIVKRALGALMAQGMIALTSRSTWPAWNDIDRRHPFEGK
jgi:hypothetical protein